MKCNEVIFCMYDIAINRHCKVKSCRWEGHSGYLQDGQRVMKSLGALERAIKWHVISLL